MRPSDRFLVNLLGLGLAASLLLTACGGSPSPAAALSNPSGTGSYASATPVDPEAGVSLTLDAEHDSSVMVPPSGGTRTAEGPDGTRYRLTIPNGALLVDTEITMTPVSSIADFPFSGGRGGALIARNWSISGGELFATLEWDPSDAGLGVTGSGTFKLFHRPGQ
jgi:hypothetical protein